MMDASANIAKARQLFICCLVSQRKVKNDVKIRYVKANERNYP
jgi:hypothetical protein